MKISKSKQELARIISENGGWINTAGFAAQDQNAVVTFFVDKPWRFDSVWECENFEAAGGFGVTEAALKNWHQTILSREEYSHLHPADEAAPKPEIQSEIMWIAQVDDIDVVESKPTIEQLAADYRNTKDYAERKQQEADEAKADAEAKLAELVAAGKEIGLALSVAWHELVITDFRDLRVGDIIEYVDGDIKEKIGMTGPVVEFEPYANDGMYVRMKCDNGPKKGCLGWPRKWRFIRRP